MDFSDKIVLITGGASGIGGVTSLAFAQAGAKVAFTYMSSGEEAQNLEQTITTAGGKCLAIQADMTTPSGVEDAFKLAETELGPVDIVFANAGGLLQRSRCADMTFDLWQQSIAVNLTSTFLTCQAALRSMEPRKTGAIVTMSSLAAFDGGGPGASHYAAMKGAVATYTRALAKEVGPLGIRVNGVAPGLIGTRFHETFNTPEGRKQTAERTPLRREGRPEDVADVVVYLSSNKAAFLTGEIVQINGGLGIY